MYVRMRLTVHHRLYYTVVSHSDITLTVEMAYLKYMYEKLFHFISIIQCFKHVYSQ